tara:strand:+ start:4578 stop:6092 length:1515 start_codon:yes stop_codon:yes gene_type:complete
MLAICSVIQNEAPYLAEWLEYHMLPHIGVMQFVLYDDASDDDTLERLRPYVRDGVVQVRTTNELRPWKNETMLKAHACRGWHTTFPNWEAPPPHDRWCVRGEPFPQQISMIRDATLRATTEFIAFIDADEFLIHAIPSPFAQWLATLDANVGGVIGMGKIMMTSKNASPLLTETKQMNLQDEFLRQKCIVRRSAVSDVSVGIVHEIALREGKRYVRDPTVAMLHFRYRGFDRRTRKRYLVLGEAPEFGRKAKLAKLDVWRRDLDRAERKHAYLHCTAGLPHAQRAMQNVWLRNGAPERASHPGVVVVAEARSGSSWFAQAVFGSRYDVLYLYEPCRSDPRSTGVGRHFDDECVHVIKTLLDCSLPLAQWKEMKADRKAVELSTPGAFVTYRSFIRMCMERRVVVKTIRVYDPSSLASGATAVVHVERDAAAVLASRKERRIVGFGLRAGQEAKRRGSNVTVKLADATRDADAVARFVTARVGWPWTDQRAKCARPLDRGWEACG